MTRERTTDDRDEKRMRERLDQDMRKDDERQRSEEAASHLAGRPLSPHPFGTLRLAPRRFPSTPFTLIPYGARSLYARPLLTPFVPRRGPSATSERSGRRERE